MLMEKRPHQAALVALNDMHGLPVLATNECHQIVADVSQTDEHKLLRCQLMYHCRGKGPKLAAPAIYWTISDKGHFTKISPSLTTIKHSLSHQLNLRTLSDGQWGLKDQSKINLGPTSKNGNFGSMLLVNQHRNQYQICVKQKCKMELNVQIITALYCHCLRGCIKLRHEKRRLFSWIQWCTEHLKLITDNILDILPMYIIWQIHA